MKGYFVWSYDDWGDYVHGLNANKAKAMMWSYWGADAGEWIDLRACRIPEFDNVPITNESIQNYIREQTKPEEQTMDMWDPICSCSICKP